MKNWIHDLYGWYFRKGGVRFSELRVDIVANWVSFVSQNNDPDDPIVVKSKKPELLSVQEFIDGLKK